MISIKIRKKIVSCFSGFGYFFCAIQWVWSILLYFSLLESAATNITTSTGTEKIEVITTQIVVSQSPPSLIAIIFAVLVTTFLLALTIYILIKMPSKIVKTSRNFVDKTAKNTAPLIIKLQHKKDTKKSRIKLTSMIILIIKVVLITVPLFLAYFSRFTTKPEIDPQIVIIIAILLAGLSTLAFSAQYFLNRMFKIKTIE